MSRACGVVVALALMACSEPEHWRALGAAGGVIHIERSPAPHEQRRVTLANVEWPPTPGNLYTPPGAPRPEYWPGRHEAEETVMAIMAEHDVTWQTDGDLVAAGLDVGTELVRRGWARAGPSAPPALVEAEAQARRERSGGWSDGHREALRRWLRRQALMGRLVGDASEDPDPQKRMLLRWQREKEHEHLVLSFFEVELDDDPATYGGPGCGDRVELWLAPTLDGPASAQRVFASPQLARVTPWAKACEAWTNEGSALTAGDANAHARRPYVLEDEGRTVRWGDAGRVPVVAAGRDAVIVGREAWFTSLEACERALAAAHPDGCVP